MDWNAGMYRDRLRSMADDALVREWKAEEGDRLQKVEHEMAMRFMGRGAGRLPGERKYFLEKFLRMPEKFREAYCKGEWARAKNIYDSAISIGLFLEAPEQVRNKVFGSRQGDEPIEGLIPDHMLDRVMRECVMKDKLGFECVVYRRPGEIGFYGAKRLPGTRLMAAEDNPACPAYHPR